MIDANGHRRSSRANLFARRRAARHSVDAGVDDRRRPDSRRRAARWHRRARLALLRSVPGRGSDGLDGVTVPRGFVRVFVPGSGLVPPGSVCSWLLFRVFKEHSRLESFRKRWKPNVQPLLADTGKTQSTECLCRPCCRRSSLARPPSTTSTMPTPTRSTRPTWWRWRCSTASAPSTRRRTTAQPRRCWARH